MRISDWSSDVCSSDLTRRDEDRVARRCGGDRRLNGKAAAVGEPYGDTAVEIDRLDAFEAVGAVRGGERPGAAVEGETVDVEAGGDDRRVLTDPTDERVVAGAADERSEEHTSELQSLMRNSYAVFCLKKKTNKAL